MKRKYVGSLRKGYMIKRRRLGYSTAARARAGIVYAKSRKKKIPFLRHNNIPKSYIAKAIRARSVRRWSNMMWARNRAQYHPYLASIKRAGGVFGTKAYYKDHNRKLFSKKRKGDYPVPPVVGFKKLRIK